MENNFSVTSASVSDRGLSEKRPENEDSFLVIDDRGVYAVADGVGGAQAGDVASQMAMEILGEAFLNQSADLDAEDVMRAAIERANFAIHQMANDLPQLSSMATTIVALHVYGNIATIGHVGDSRAYRLDQSGTLRRETHDHSVVEEEVRAGRMTAEQAQNHPSKNVISRALGAEEDVDIDLKTIMVEPGTTFLLCSDGITRHISDDEIAMFLGAESDPSQICEGMKELCYDRGAEDNLTAVVVRVAADVKEFSAAAGAAGDHEEVTVASARSPFESTVEEVLPESVEDDGDLSTSDTLELDELDDQSYLMEDPDEILGETKKEDLQDYSSSSMVVPAQQPAPPVKSSPPQPTIGRRDEVRVVEVASSGGGSKMLSALLFLLLGAVLGAAAYYAWMGSQPETVVEIPVYPEPKSNNVALTAFEETRGIVDRDPVGYINANAASMREADDYFWMGRAFLLTGKNWEAKRAFIDARNRLATADPKNAKTMATEIAMALAIIESPQATEVFTRDLATANASNVTNTNTNTNTAAPAPAQPQR